MGGHGDVGRADLGMQGLQFKIRDARSGMQGGEKQMEQFSTSNEYKIQIPEDPRSLTLSGTA